MVGAPPAPSVLQEVRQLPPLSPAVAAVPPAPSRPAPPSPGADPAAGRELTPFEDKRVSRLVRKEVASSLAATSPLDHLSRGALDRLTAQVSSALGRRLLAEKERRGLSGWR